MFKLVTPVLSTETLGLMKHLSQYNNDAKTKGVNDEAEH